MTSATPSGNLGNLEVLELFESLARCVWEWLRDARRLRVGLSEETITDLTSLEILRRPSAQVRVGRVSKREEKDVGFDWLWVFWRGDRIKHVLVVQAKKLTLDDSCSYRYAKLRYPSQAPFQIDAIEAFAKWLGVPAFYCFYNNVDDTTASKHWRCSPPLDAPQLGCTLVPLDLVRPVHD
ncbi:MAG: hypothetical protein OXK79_06390, partial [Chloroflexota bacterium]|nr:hypothetical protein [Chloroflexota bacterium]